MKSSDKNAESVTNAAAKRPAEVNYDKVSFYDFKKTPRVPGKFWVGLELLLSKMTMPKVELKIDKINMEGCKPPFILLSNHAQFIDFQITALATYPLPLCNIVAIDGFTKRAWLMEAIGSVAKRKFVNETNVVRSVKAVLNKGGVLSMYPEARYTPIGTLAVLPESLGKLCQLMKVPVVTMMHHGNYLQKPFWDHDRMRNVPLHSVMKKILTVQELQTLSAEEVNARITKEMQYDEYRYWQKTGFKITEPYRAEGLHKVLYQCPACGAEFQMNTEGAELYCEACGKRWELTETGWLKALSGETEFPHVPDWFEWERANVRKQIDDGEYNFEDDVELYSLPGSDKYHYLGKAKLYHNEKGFLIEGHHNGQPIKIERKPLTMYSLHVEYDYFRVIKGRDAVDISTDTDSYFCFLSRRTALTKLSLATEELYKSTRARTRRRKTAEQKDNG